MGNIKAAQTVRSGGVEVAREEVRRVAGPLSTTLRAASVPFVLAGWLAGRLAGCSLAG